MLTEYPLMVLFAKTLLLCVVALCTMVGGTVIVAWFLRGAKPPMEPRA